MFAREVERVVLHRVYLYRRAVCQVFGAWFVQVVSGHSLNLHLRDIIQFDIDLSHGDCEDVF